MQVLAFSYTGGAAPLAGDPTAAPTPIPDPDFVIPEFCDQFLGRRRLDGEQPPLPSEHYFEEERFRRGLQNPIDILGAGIATMRFPGGAGAAPPSGRRLGGPEQEHHNYEGRGLQEGGSVINLEFAVLDGDLYAQSSASTTSVLFTMGLFLAGALIANM
jgi:hypothetical protein